ncbi:MAG: hypothetical protein IKN43_10620, partial [Selenomonadaceae bacterium]|nr:hypothetical protein [Selenomonadaceae bacterium]
DIPSEPMLADGTISHAIERIFPFVAQSQGYYSGLLMTEEYASLYLENYRYMLYKTVNHYLDEEKYQTFIDTPGEEELWREFYNKYDDIYILGFGAYSSAFLNYLLEQPVNKFRGFIRIPDPPDIAISFPMFNISEIDFQMNVGIMITSRDAEWGVVKYTLDENYCEKIFIGSNK